jgi:methylthioribose-1-phosphate isomerase
VTVVPDAAAPALIAEGGADIVVAGADRVAANGDVVATTGAYALALAAAHAGIPFVVFAPTTAVDLATADGAAAPVEEWRSGEIVRFDGRQVAADGATGSAPRQDRTPADLVSAIVTEEGVLRRPLGPALAVAVASADVRRQASPGFAALAGPALTAPAVGEPG